MKLISSSSTRSRKRVVPTIWFGGTGLGLLVGLGATLLGDSSDMIVPFVCMPAGIMAFGFLLMKKFVFDLVDEVWDCGDFILVKNAGEEEQIPLSDIVNVNFVGTVNPPRITLALRQPHHAGQEIAFIPPPRLLPAITQHPLAQQLITRIDEARRRV